MGPVLKTNYYGVELQRQGKVYWLFYGNGCEKAYDHCPTDSEVEKFVDEIVQ